MTADDHYGFGLITDGGSNDSLIGHSGGIIGYSTLALHSAETAHTAFWVVAGEEIDLSTTIEDLADRIAG